MLFNSLHFLVFFPIVALMYFFIPQRIRWIWLLAASYYFYMAWNPQYAILMGISTIITYLSGIFIQRFRDASRIKRLCVALSFALNLLILFFFKYFYFITDSILLVFAAFGINLTRPAFDVLLPVGISFYTFQALSYTVDVYRQEISAEKNLGKYALFVSFFPQLVAGPIERSKNLLTQVNHPRPFSYEKMCSGLVLMLWGLFQKIVIADRMAVIVNAVYDNFIAFSGVQILFATVLFTFQIYCDFAGYSNIAIGAAEVMGFSLMENFKNPYFAVSIRDFWRRWHISLSTWFRDYLYIPLGGNRVGKWRQRCNIMLTFLCSGLWHGAQWNFVIWGGLHGAFHVIGDMLMPIRESIRKFLHIGKNSLFRRLARIAITFPLVCFAWIFFRAPGARAAFSMVGQIITSFQPSSIGGGGQSLGLNNVDIYLMVLGFLVLFCSSLVGETQIEGLKLQNQKLPIRWLIYIFLLFTILFTVVYYADIQGQQFIYFQF